MSQAPTPSETTAWEPVMSDSPLTDECIAINAHRQGSIAETASAYQLCRRLERDRAWLMEALRGIDDFLSGSLPITAQVKAIISDVLKELT